MDSENFNVGTYVTHPDYRRKGIGSKVWKACVTNLMDQGKNIILNSVSGKEKMYETSGLRQADLKLIEFSSQIDIENIKVITIKNVEVVPVKSVPFNKILSYDKIVQDMPRRIVLEYLLKDTVSGFAALRNGTLVGYACARKAVIGYRLGPVYADNEEIAISVASKTLKDLPSDSEYIESNIFVKNTAARHLLETLGIADNENVCHHTRMYSKSMIPFRLDKVYCIIDFDTSVC